MKTIHIVLPILNEERRLPQGLDKLLPFMEEHFKGRYVITIVDNGSTDATESIAHAYEARNKSLHYMKINRRGVGIAFRTGCEINKSDIVGYMDIDLATDINHLLDTDRYFEDPKVDIVNASRYSKGSQIIGRKWYRSITSYGLMFILKAVFRVKFNDSISGFKFFKRETVNVLNAEASDEPGWFYCIELLIRAERKGFVIKEIPAKWTDNHDSKVRVFKLASNYIKNIIKLNSLLRKEKTNG